MARPDEINDTPSVPAQNTDIPSIPAPNGWDPDRNENEGNIQSRNWGADREERRLQESQDAKKFTEEELAQRLKDIKDINELKKVLQEIIWSMEKQLMSILQEISGWDGPTWIRSYEWIWNLDDEYWDEELSLFEKKWIDIMNKAKNLLAQIEEWNAEVNLLTFLQQASSELYQTQNKAEEDLRTDMKDGKLTYRAFTSQETFEHSYAFGWSMLFFSHSNPNKFRELLNSKSTGRLIGEVFSISEWAWAFNDWYAEIKKRLNWKNIFDEIDDIAADWHDRELDWTADFLENITVSGMLNNGKINDLDKYISTYKDSERIKNNIRKKLRMNIVSSMWWGLDSDSFLSDILKHFDEVKQSPILWDIAKELEETNPTIRVFNEMKEDINKQEIDILKNKRVNALMVFDNDDLAWSWAEYFKPNIAKFKRLWYTTEIENTKTPDMEKVVLQKWNNENERITLCRLKEIYSEENADNQSASYDRVFNELKGNSYNLFSLRWHCYNTEEMAWRLWELWMVSESSILIDWWCWNARHTDEYINWGITCPMFTYTNTWKWATTEALVDIILREKNKWGNLWTLLNSIKQWMNWNSPTLKWMKTMNMPDSPYTLYSLAKQKTNRDYAAIETGAWEPRTWDEITPVASDDIAMNTGSDEGL